MWVVDLIIACQKAKQKKEEKPHKWHFDVEGY
jgi:hypothetical protein